MQAIIYKMINYKASDRLIYLFTERGYKTAILKNAQKLSSDNFNISEIMLLDIIFKNEENNILQIEKLNILEEYKNIKQDYTSLKNTMALFKIVQDLVKDDEDIATIFLILKKMLYNLIGIKSIFYAFFIKLTYFLGIRVDIYLESEVNDKKLREELLYLYNQKLEIIKDKKDFDYDKIKTFIKIYYQSFLSYKVIGV